jgi:hypothetical protein
MTRELREAFKYAKDRMKKGELPATFLAYTDSGERIIMEITLREPYRGLTLQMVTLFFAAHKVTRYIHMSEAWARFGFPVSLEIAPSKAPDRKEVLIAIDVAATEKHAELGFVHRNRAGKVVEIEKADIPDLQIAGAFTDLLPSDDERNIPVDREQAVQVFERLGGRIVGVVKQSN